MISLVRKLLTKSSGFSLVEVSVAVAVLSMGVGLVGSAVFQVISVQRFWEDDRVATKDTRHAASWFAGDTLEATATSLVNNDPAVNTVTLTLDSGSVTYSLSGTDLVRSAGGAQNVVSKDVVSVAFSLADNVLTFVLEVSASRGGTEILTLNNYLRMME